MYPRGGQRRRWRSSCCPWLLGNCVCMRTLHFLTPKLALCSKQRRFHLHQILNATLLLFACHCLYRTPRVNALVSAARSASGQCRSIRWCSVSPCLVLSQGSLSNCHLYFTLPSSESAWHVACRTWQKVRAFVGMDYTREDANVIM